MRCEATIRKGSNPTPNALGCSAVVVAEPVVERLPISFPLLVRARLGRALLSQIDKAADDAGRASPERDAAC